MSLKVCLLVCYCTGVLAMEEENLFNQKTQTLPSHDYKSMSIEKMEIIQQDLQKSLYHDLIIIQDRLSNALHDISRDENWDKNFKEACLKLKKNDPGYFGWSCNHANELRAEIFKIEQEKKEWVRKNYRYNFIYKGVTYLKSWWAYFFPQKKA
jgi:hypothetical protein